MRHGTETKGIQEANRLYEQYVKPLEAEHWGEYVVVTPAGEVVLASTLVEAAEKAQSTLGSGNFAFKVGQKSVGKWRRIGLN